MEIPEIVPDERLALAYTAMLESLKNQDSTLGSMRNRATALFSATTVAATFAAAVGLFDPKHSTTALPTWTSVALLVGVIIIGGLTTAVLWPVDWTRGASSLKILAKRDLDWSLNNIRRYVLEETEKGRQTNEEHISRCSFLYKLGLLVLLAEFGVLALGVATR